VNNAFAGIFSPFLEVTAEEYERVTAVTYLGQVNGTRAALKRMMPRGHGKVVLVGSALAYRGIPLQSAYCGAKHAIQGFLDSVRCELLHAKTDVSITMVQLPGVNTPQFDWIRAKLPGKPRPVGTVYQPEVAARGIYFAAHRKRKEVFVGVPTVEAIWGNKIASPLLDDYLARTGFKSQQNPEPVSPDRKDNLFEPVPGDHGAHGRFDAEAVDDSAELWVSTHKKQLGLAALGAAAAGAGLFFAARRWNADAKAEV
jgi:short-subunit dehydrogenase